MLIDVTEAGASDDKVALATAVSISVGWAEEEEGPYDWRGSIARLAEMMNGLVKDAVSEGAGVP